MKSFLFSILVVAAAAVALIYPFHCKVLPQALRNGNAQILATWRESLIAYKEELGEYPPFLPGMSREESIVNGLNKQNRLGKAYIEIGGYVRLKGILPTDAWNNGLMFDPDNTGDFSEIRSAGPDGLFQTEDDMLASQCVKHDLPPDLFDEDMVKKAAAKGAEGKSKPEGDAKSDARGAKEPSPEKPAPPDAPTR